MNEFRLAVRSLPAVAVSAEDVSNAMGLAVDDAHYARSATAIALERSVAQMRPLLAQLFVRLRYVLSRMLLYVRDGFVADGGGGGAVSGTRATMAAASPEAAASSPGVAASPAAAVEALLAGDQLWESLASAFDDNLASTVRQCASACDGDLGVLGRLALLGCGTSLGASARSNRLGAVARADTIRVARGGGMAAAATAAERHGGGMAAAMGAGALARGSGGTAEVLVQRSVGEWRQHVSEAVARKVHAQLVLSVLDTLPNVLAAGVEAFQRSFDLASVREQLKVRRVQLQKERATIGQMAHRFEHVARAHNQ